LKKTVIIAIDGPSSSGKSTIAKLIAKHLKFTYIDSGSIYRAVTYLALKNNLLDKSNINTSAIIEILKKTSISFSFNSKNQNIISVDGIQLEDKIRTFKISSLVSLLAEKNEIRKYIVKIQKDISRNKSIVMDGRDIGTVVFPNADVKFYLDASLKERSQRRWKELSKTESISLDQVKKDLKNRDDNDINRDHSPLMKSKNSITIFTDNLSIDEVVKKMIKIIDKEKLN
jgi:cytidylate kinase